MTTIDTTAAAARIDALMCKCGHRRKDHHLGRGACEFCKCSTHRTAGYPDIELSREAHAWNYADLLIDQERGT